MHHKIRLGRVVRFQMNAIIMQTIHTLVHHEY